MCHTPVSASNYSPYRGRRQRWMSSRSRTPPLLLSPAAAAVSSPSVLSASYQRRHLPQQKPRHRGGGLWTQRRPRRVFSATFCDRDWGWANGAENDLKPFGSGYKLCDRYAKISLYNKKHTNTRTHATVSAIDSRVARVCDVLLATTHEKQHSHQRPVINTRHTHTRQRMCREFIS